MIHLGDKMKNAKRVTKQGVGIMVILLFFSALGIIILPFIIPDFLKPNISDILVDSLIIIITLYLLYESVCIWRFNFGNREFKISNSEIVLPSLRLNPYSGDIAYYSRKHSIIKISEVKNILLANEEHVKHIEIQKAVNIPTLIENIEGLIIEKTDGSHYGVRNFPNIEYDFQEKLKYILSALDYNNHPLANNLNQNERQK